MKKRKAKPKLDQPLKVPVVRPRPSIAQLEALLTQEEDVEIEILPNGEIRFTKKTGDLGEKKPLTLREDLGDEYAA